MRSQSSPPWPPQTQPSSRLPAPHSPHANKHAWFLTVRGRTRQSFSTTRNTKFWVQRISWRVRLPRNTNVQPFLPFSPWGNEWPRPRRWRCCTYRELIQGRMCRTWHFWYPWIWRELRLRWPLHRRYHLLKLVRLFQYFDATQWK